MQPGSYDPGCKLFPLLVTISCQHLLWRTGCVAVAHGISPGEANGAGRVEAIGTGRIHKRTEADRAVVKALALGRTNYAAVAEVGFHQRNIAGVNCAVGVDIVPEVTGISC